MATALAYARQTDSLIIADSLNGKSLDGKAADEKKFFMLDDILEKTCAPLIKAATYLPLSSGDILEDMLKEASAISEMCGFADPLCFSRQFKKRIGISPTEYRKMNLI